MGPAPWQRSTLSMSSSSDFSSFRAFTLLHKYLIWPCPHTVLDFSTSVSGFDVAWTLAPGARQTRPLSSGHSSALASVRLYYNHLLKELLHWQDKYTAATHAVSVRVVLISPCLYFCVMRRHWPLLAPVIPSRSGGRIPPSRRQRTS